MKIFRSHTRIMIATSVATALLFGCGSSSSSGSTNTDAASGYGIYGKTQDTTVTPSSTSSQITIKGAAFTVTGDVKSTDVVSVTNNDSFKHTVTSDDGVFDVTVEGGTTVSLPALNPGVYSFHCKIHSTMHGTLTVI
jgi:plastocyanin